MHLKGPRRPAGKLQPTERRLAEDCQRTLGKTRTHGLRATVRRRLVRPSLLPGVLLAA